MIDPTWDDYRPKECAPGTHVGTLVWKDHANAGRRFYIECNSCGSVSSMLAKGKYDPASAIPCRGLREQLHRQAMEAYDAAKANARQAWFDAHDAYLKTDKWGRLRAKVIERDGGLCQGCREAPGVEVHHLSYERWQNELLTDLVLFCCSCHERWHASRVS